MATFEENFLYPLILLLVGALVSGVLVSYLTNKWRLHQKGQEIKIDLVGRISQTVMSIMTMIDSPIESEDPEKSVEELHRQIRVFRVDSGVIGTELHAYFPGTDCPENIGKKWDCLEDDITEIFNIFIACIEDKKANKETESGEVKEKTDIKKETYEGIYREKLKIILLALVRMVGRRDDKALGTDLLLEDFEVILKRICDEYKGKHTEIEALSAVTIIENLKNNRAHKL